jgi:hypothetical protein
VDAIEHTLTRIEGMLTGGTTRAAAPGLGRGDVEAITRAELERGKAAEAEAAKQQQAAGALDQLRADVAALKETRPRPPVRAITKFFWPGHDRD